MNLPERHLRRLELTITRRLDGLLHGEHLGLLPGPGTELAEARLYQPGSDDVRHMDWPVTARTTIPHVRDLIADHELETWALVDLTASMDFGTTDHEKRDLAVAAVAAVGFLTARLGDRIGAWILNHGELRRVPARAGRSALYGLLRTLNQAPRTPATTGGPTLTDAITGLSRGRRGLRVIISDLLDPPAAWEKPLRALAARHQVLAIEIIDPRELDLPDVGVVHLADAETGAVREIMLDRRTRAAYAQAAAAQREDTRQALRGAGAAHLVLRTDRDWVADIARFALRQRRVAGRRAGIRT
ncbi:MAG TPA: DUF58 domain-containing protein [Streptosporangiaceae bacterium]|nr:DUF58 domain-containing protein [Streptosporangiaceae bacterium]